MDKSRRKTLASFKTLGSAAIIASMFPAAAAVARPGLRVKSDWVDPRDFGAIADGTSHPLSARYRTLGDARAVYPFAATLGHEIDWCAIQAAINAGAQVKVSRGHFRINETLSLRSNSEIRGAGPDTVLIWSRNEQAEVFSMFGAQGVTGIRLGNFSVLDNSGSRGGYVFAGNNVIDVQVEKLVSKGMAIAAFEASAEVSDRYDHVVIDTAGAKFNGSADVHVSGCAASDVAASSDPCAAVLFRYCIGWSVTNCKFSNTPFGVQWWGGDSDPERDGALMNRRKCLHGAVTNVEVSNCIAGVWGSMGSDVRISGCEVDTASDVGIDFEGCVNCVASQNRVRNCANGNFTIFWWNVGISFVENVSRQRRSDYPHLRVYNASQGIENHSLLVKGNQFSTEGTIGVIDTGSGCVEKLDFLDNDLLDTKVEFVANNLRYVNVTGNTVTFSLLASRPFYAIQVGELHNSGRGLVERNTIESKVAQPRGTSAIYLWSDDYNADTQFEVVMNRTVGFQIDLVTDNKGRNPGKTSYFMIEGNVFGARAYRKEEHGSKASSCFLRANQGIQDSVGKPWSTSGM
ncbi:hypothetical protein PQR75_37765 [Paraburkholderia fungorum]|uniref:hypothetical protein n=1 Tax=Paraburkholderia fungorum TaxID=134537 RepID=UPI0038BBB4A5